MARRAPVRALPVLSLLLGFAFLATPVVSACGGASKCVKAEPCPTCPVCPATAACPECAKCPEAPHVDTPPVPADAGEGLPTFAVTSASVDILYWKAGNTLNISPVGLPAGTAITVKASQADVLRSQSDPTKVTIVPSGKTCVVSVSATVGGQLVRLGDRKFRVIKPPMPRFQLIVNGKEYNGAAPISKKSNVIVKLKPDSDFLAALPKDARYMIDKVDLLAQRSLGAPSKVGSFNGSGKDAAKGIPAPLGNKLKPDTPGTKIYFKVGKVFRVNFQNKKIEEKFADRELYLGAIIK